MKMKKANKKSMAKSMGKSVYKKGGATTKSIKAPAGFHWMKKGNEYRLMKHSGKFVPHKNASLVAKFKVQKVHR